MKKILITLLLILCVLAVVGCGQKSAEASYTDGTYTAKSDSQDERGGYGEVEIIVDGGKISQVDFKTYNKDGSVKDETYGQGLPEGQYKIAQSSIAANAEYAKQLVEYQQLIDVDAVSGATWNYQLFQDAVEKALKQAQAK